MVMRSHLSNNDRYGLRTVIFQAFFTDTPTELASVSATGLICEHNVFYLEWRKNKKYFVKKWRIYSFQRKTS